MIFTSHLEDRDGCRSWPINPWSRLPQGAGSLTGVAVAAADKRQHGLSEMGTSVGQTTRALAMHSKSLGLCLYLLGRSHVKRVTSPDFQALL